MGGLVAVQGKVALPPLLVPHDKRIVDGNSPRAAGEAELLCQGGKQTLAGAFRSRGAIRPLGEVWGRGGGAREHGAGGGGSW